MSELFRDALRNSDAPDKDTRVFNFNSKKIKFNQLNDLVLIMLSDIEGIAFSATHFVRHNSFTRMEKMQIYLNFVLLDDSKCKIKASKCRSKTENGDICMRCDKCVGKFTLTAKGPGFVNTSDIQETDESNGIRVNDFARPLFYLDHGEDVNLILYAARGTGREHARFRQITTAYAIPAEINKTKYHQLWIESAGVVNPEDIFEKSLRIYEERKEGASK